MLSTIEPPPDLSHVDPLILHMIARVPASKMGEIGTLLVEICLDGPYKLNRNP